MYKLIFLCNSHYHTGTELNYFDTDFDPTTGRVKFYGLASGFRSWFVLQHYKRFAYKPFLTVIELSYPFQGELK
ncbi:DUF3289 family protein [Aeromonas salmonicida]|uniref:DUF3289 family protein n=1 Tax=Aeromonas salmonicida TaxID=645 RepID=UPI003B50C179